MPTERALLGFLWAHQAHEELRQAARPLGLGEAMVRVLEDVVAFPFDALGFRAIASRIHADFESLIAA